MAIASRLGISEHTVKAHRANIYRSLHIHSAPELAIEMAGSAIGSTALRRAREGASTRVALDETA